MNFASAALWGFAATIVLTTIEAAGRGLGMTRISIPFMLGTIVTGNRETAALYGLLLHLMFGWLFALLYALIFQSVGFASWWLGLFIGLVHSLFVLMALIPVLPAIHPRMAGDLQGPNPTPMLAPPGFMALTYGRMTAVVTIISHAMFGIVLGVGYAPIA